jgi:hypothetical protein
MNTKIEIKTKSSGLLSHPDKVSGKRGSVYEQITDRIIAMLEAGSVPWQKPWKVATGLPRNLVSKKPYRGMNVLLLHAMSYESPFWLTFRQAKELGGSIKKGEKSCPVIFGKRQETEDEITGEKSHYVAALQCFQRRPMRRFKKCSRTGSSADDREHHRRGHHRLYAKAARNQIRHEQSLLFAQR